MIPETENTQEAKRVYPGKPAQSRYCWFSRGTTHITARCISVRVDDIRCTGHLRKKRYDFNTVESSVKYPTPAHLSIFKFTGI